MSTMKGKIRRMVLTGIAGLAATVGIAPAARAAISSDQPGGIIVFPKVVVDTDGSLHGGVKVDTEIQMVNTSNSVIGAKCYLVNATSYCENEDTKACLTNSDCSAGDRCKARWDAHDFYMLLTKRQPVSWKASEGLSKFPCDPNCGLGAGQTNVGSRVPPTSAQFFGEIKCIEVDPADLTTPTMGFNPANNGAGDLIGAATIVSSLAPAADARKYNGITFPILHDPKGDDELTLGPGSAGEYSGCPTVLTMDHLFDDANVQTHKIGGSSTVAGTVRSDLTVVPCTQNYLLGADALSSITLQFLVFNEFEQRFSTSTGFNCWREVGLSDIDSRPGPFGDAQSIFNVAVQGTISGQTRIRPVESAGSANGVLGLLEEFWQCSNGPAGTCTTARNMHIGGENLNRGDKITLSPTP